MKKFFALITFAAVLNFSYAPTVIAEEDTTATEVVAEEVTTEVEEPVEAPVESALEEVEEAPQSFHQTLKTKFIEGAVSRVDQVTGLHRAGLRRGAARLDNLHQRISALV